MNGTGRHNKNSGYLVILLLLVGLTSFSHTMKELTEIHQLTWEASRLIAQWSGDVKPAEIRQTLVKVEKLESCESKQSAATVELPWLKEASAAVSNRTQQIKIERITRPVIATHSEAQIAKLKKLQHLDINADELEVRMPNVQFPEADAFEKTDFTFRTKARQHSPIKFNSRDHEMILKTLNRSINLRIAS